MEANIHLKTDGSLTPVGRDYSNTDTAPLGRQAGNEAGGAGNPVLPLAGRNIMPTEYGYGSYFGTDNEVVAADGEVLIQDQFPYVLESGEVVNVRLTSNQVQIDSIASPGFVANPIIRTPHPLLAALGVAGSTSTTTVNLGIHLVQGEFTGTTWLDDTLADSMTLVGSGYTEYTDFIRTRDRMAVFTRVHGVTNPLDPLTPVTKILYSELQKSELNQPTGGTIGALIDEAAMAAAYGTVKAVQYTANITHFGSISTTVGIAGEPWASMLSRIFGSDQPGFSFNESSLVIVQVGVAVAPSITFPSSTNNSLLRATSGSGDPLSHYFNLDYSVPIPVDLTGVGNATGLNVLIPSLDNAVHGFILNNDTGTAHYVAPNVLTYVHGTNLSWHVSAFQGTPPVDVIATPAQGTQGVMLRLEVPNSQVPTVPSYVITHPIANPYIYVDQFLITFDYITWWKHDFVVPNPSTLYFSMDDGTGNPRLIDQFGSSYPLTKLVSSTIPINSTGVVPITVTRFTQPMEIGLVQAEVKGTTTVIRLPNWNPTNITSISAALIIDGVRYPASTYQAKVIFPIRANANSILATSPIFHKWTKAAINNRIYFFQEGSLLAYTIKSDGSGVVPVVFGQLATDYADQVALLDAEVTRNATLFGVTEAVVRSDLLGLTTGAAKWALWEEPTQVMIDMTVIKGITASEGRIIAWDATGSILYSGNVPLGVLEIDGWVTGQPPLIYDFVAAHRGAGTTKAPAQKGRLVSILPTAKGFRMYCTGSIITGYPTNTGSVFGFKTHASSVGVFDEDQIVEADHDTHFAVTSIGLASITDAGISILDAKVSDKLQKSKTPVALRFLNNRYLTLSGVWEPDREVVAGSTIIDGWNFPPEVIKLPPNEIRERLGLADCPRGWDYYGYRPDLYTGATTIELFSETTFSVLRVEQFGLVKMVQHVAALMGLAAMTRQTFSVNAGMRYTPCGVSAPPICSVEVFTDTNSYDYYGYNVFEYAFPKGSYDSATLEQMRSIGNGATIVGSSFSVGASYTNEPDLGKRQALDAAWSKAGLTKPATMTGDYITLPNNNPYTLGVHGGTVLMTPRDILLSTGFIDAAIVVPEVVVGGAKALTLESADTSRYSVYEEALVLDTLTKKWGRCNTRHRLLIDYTPINAGSFDALTGNRNAILNYSSFQGSLGGVLANGSTVAYNDNPVDSYIEYGKVALGIASFTKFQQVTALFTKTPAAKLSLLVSIDGDTVEAAYSTSFAVLNSSNRTLTAQGTAVGRWGTVLIEGKFDVRDIYVAATRGGRR